MFIIGVSLGGKAICNAMQMAVPSYVEVLDANKMYCCLGSFFVGSQI